MIARAAAGVVLGFPLSGLLLALLLEPWPRHGQAALIPVLLLFFPLWTAIVGGSFLFRSGRHAWLALALANAAAFGLLWVLRHG